jgi:hypothetical protein
VKYWRGENNDLQRELVPLNTYDTAFEGEKEIAATDRESLLQLHTEEGLSAAMQAAWETAVDNDELNGRTPQIFRQGPPDRFVIEPEKIAEWFDPDETQEVAVPMFLPRLDVLPVDVFSPEGETLGVSAMVISRPIPDFVNDVLEERVNALEVAQFASRAEASTFRQSFLNFYEHTYTGDVKALAEEVAHGNGLPTDWTSLSQQQALDMQRGNFSLTHGPEEWRAERGASTADYTVDMDF